jgi:host factor-I protein
MKSADGNRLQGTYLNDLRKQRMSVQIYLISGVRLTGMIESFDQHALMLRQGSSMELVYKHMISSIMPAAKALPVLPTPRAAQTVLHAGPTNSPLVIRKVARRTTGRDQ